MVITDISEPIAAGRSTDLIAIHIDCLNLVTGIGLEGEGLGTATADPHIAGGRDGAAGAAVRLNLIPGRVAALKLHIESVVVADVVEGVLVIRIGQLAAVHVDGGDLIPVIRVECEGPVIATSHADDAGRRDGTTGTAVSIDVKLGAIGALKLDIDGVVITDIPEGILFRNIGQLLAIHIDCGHLVAGLRVKHEGPVLVTGDMDRSRRCNGAAVTAVSLNLVPARADRREVHIELVVLGDIIECVAAHVAHILAVYIDCDDLIPAVRIEPEGLVIAAVNERASRGRYPAAGTGSHINDVTCVVVHVGIGQSALTDCDVIVGCVCGGERHLNIEHRAIGMAGSGVCGVLRLAQAVRAIELTVSNVVGELGVVVNAAPHISDLNGQRSLLDIEVNGLVEPPCVSADTNDLDGSPPSIAIVGVAQLIVFALIELRSALCCNSGTWGLVRAVICDIGDAADSHVARNVRIGQDAICDMDVIVVHPGETGGDALCPVAPVVERILRLGERVVAIELAAGERVTEVRVLVDCALDTVDTDIQRSFIDGERQGLDLVLVGAEARDGDGCDACVPVVVVREFVVTVFP